MRAGGSGGKSQPSENGKRPSWVLIVPVAFVGIVSVARELSSVTQGTVQFAPLGLPMLVGNRSA